MSAVCTKYVLKLPQLLADLLNLDHQLFLINLTQQFTQWGCCWSGSKLGTVLWQVQQGSVLPHHGHCQGCPEHEARDGQPVWPGQKVWIQVVNRVANCAHWFLKLPHSEAKEQMIFNVNILGGSSSVLELLETIGNSAGGRGVGVRILFFYQNFYLY